MSENKPDAVVREETARAAIDDVTRRVVETQADIGVPIPGGRVVEDFVRGAVEQQIKVHEDRFRNGVPDPTPIADSPARIDRGEVGEDTTALSRPLESDEWDRSWTAPEGRAWVTGRPRPRSLHDMLLEARLNLIRDTPLPEFQDFFFRLLRCGEEAQAIALRQGFAGDWPKILDLKYKLMLDLVELSGATRAMGGLGLGDYRTPQGKATKIMITASPQVKP